jgi:hypothetical protein
MLSQLLFRFLVNITPCIIILLLDLLRILYSMAVLSLFSTGLVLGETLKDLSASSISTKPPMECIF